MSAYPTLPKLLTSRLTPSFLFLRPVDASARLHARRVVARHAASRQALPLERPRRAQACRVLLAGGLLPMGLCILRASLSSKAPCRRVSQADSPREYARLPRQLLRASSAPAHSSIRLQSHNSPHLSPAKHIPRPPFSDDASHSQRHSLSTTRRHSSTCQRRGQPRAAATPNHHCAPWSCVVCRLALDRPNQQSARSTRRLASEQLIAVSVSSQALSPPRSFTRVRASAGAVAVA